jgi:hypothetical protein
VAVARGTAVAVAFTTIPAHRHIRSAATITPREDSGNRTGRAVSVPGPSAVITTAGNREASQPAAAAALAEDMEAVDFTGAVVTAAAIAKCKHHTINFSAIDSWRNRRCGGQI